MSATVLYVEALNEIAKALRPPEDGATIAWDVELLPGQVSGELQRLRTENEKLRKKSKRRCDPAWKTLAAGYRDLCAAYRLGGEQRRANAALGMVDRAKRSLRLAGELPEGW